MLLYACLLFALLSPADVAADTSTSILCLYKASARQLAGMKLRLYEGSNTRYIEVPIAKASDLMTSIDTRRESVVYVHGWLDFQDPGTTELVINAYLSLGYYNVIRLNWDAISNNLLYNYAACSTPDVGYYLGKALGSLTASGLNKTTLFLVGHSLGAQIIGFAARAVNFTVEMLIGLDPAGPGFHTSFQHLASGDGKFVAIVHTDRGVTGIDLQTGDVDFYPNNGINLQPSCPAFFIISDYCSHYRAPIYWAETVRNRKSFLARKCGSWNDFKAGLCNSNEVIEMGHGMPTTASGRYYLQTNAKSPYGRGKAGATDGGILQYLNFFRE